MTATTPTAALIILALTTKNIVAQQPAIIWERNLSTSAHEVIESVAADGLGGIYLTGYTFGKVGASNAGSADAFVGKYDTAGNLQWIQQFGTSNFDTAEGVATDALSNVYVG